MARAQRIAGARGTGGGEAWARRSPVPDGCGATITYGHIIDDVRMALADGNVTDYAVEPPLPPISDRIPVTDADRRGVSIQWRWMLNRVTGTGDPVSPEACNRKVAVFDGRVRSICTANSSR